ncbi:MAG: exo-alpha-sialidase [Acidobacteria bacterium]|nr:exo-alpha-sialidase [Acidobacteriota bacterium]
MRILIPLLLVSSTLLPQDSGFKGDVNGIRVIRHVDKHPESWRLWQPFIAQWKRRQLVVAFGAMANGKKDMGSILASVSTNDGDSWEEPVAIFDHRIRQGAQQYGYANPVLFRPPGQEVIWCFAMRCPLNYTNSEDSHLTAAYTADGGRTWTQVELAMDYGGPLILNAGIEPVVVNGQQRYLLPAHRNTLQKDERGSRDHFVLSSSSLLEWRLESYIPQPSTGNKVFLHEGNIAPGDTAGELKIMMRTAGYEDASQTTNPPRAYSSVSKDSGRTWSPAQAEPDLHNAKSKSYYGRAKDGTHVYVYSDGPAQPAKGSRTSLRYKTKAPGGAWSEERTFYDAGIKNSYPTLIELAPGDFRAVWDSGTANTPRTHINFGRFRIKP